MSGTLSKVLRTALLVITLAMACCYSGHAMAGCPNQTSTAEQLACWEGMVQGISIARPETVATIQQACGSLSHSNRAACLQQQLMPLLAAASVTQPVDRARALPSSSLSSPPEDRPWRLELGVGYGHGRHDGRFDLGGGQLQLRSFIGGAGYTARVAGWHDGLWGHANLSVGLEYLHLSNRSRADLVLPNGLDIVTDPVTGQANLSAQADLLLANLVWRDRSDARLHPFLGGGLGAGYGRAELNYHLNNDVFGSVRDQQRTASIIPALQGLGGVTIDLNDRLSLLLQTRLLYVPGKLFIDHHYLNLSLEGGIGYRF
ncbi:MAG: hypothetical protein HQL58_08570 [Magnetococcales bacterium]|nr:hypothetical protein [Magnetococcales bacterium]